MHVPAGQDAAVLGLVLLSIPSAVGLRVSALFVVTESQTLSFNLSGATKVCSLSSIGERYVA
jgi:hypothetical protein